MQELYYLGKIIYYEHLKGNMLFFLFLYRAVRSYWTGEDSSMEWSGAGKHVPGFQLVQYKCGLLGNTVLQMQPNMRAGLFDQAGQKTTTINNPKYCDSHHYSSR